MPQVTKLINVNNFNTKNLIFAKPEQGSKKLASSQRIKISVRHSATEEGPLLIRTGRLYTYGLRENKNFETEQPDGTYKVGIRMWDDNKDPTSEQKEFYDCYSDIVDACKDHIIAMKRELKKGMLEKSDLKHFDPCKKKKNEHGEVDENAGPVLNAKVISFRKDNELRFITSFHDKLNHSQKIEDPLTVINRSCYADSVIQIESIFVGAQIALQVKLYETVFEFADGPRPSLLLPLLSGSIQYSENSQNPLTADEPEVEKADSINGDEHEEPVPPPKPSRSRKTKTGSLD